MPFANQNAVFIRVDISDSEVEDSEFMNAMYFSPEIQDAVYLHLESQEQVTQVKT